MWLGFVLYTHHNSLCVLWQDQQLNSLKSELSALQNKQQESDKQAQDLSQQIQQLRDQNALLKAQKGTVAGESQECCQFLVLILN